MNDSLLWAPATKATALLENELHVWRARLNPSASSTESFRRMLSPDEIERAGKFIVPYARERYTTVRGILRQLLGAYLGIEPNRVELKYGPQGKPYVARQYGSDIRFNVSHSQEMGLFVFARDKDVGVDVEQIKADFKGMEIATRFFSEDEVGELAGLAPNIAEEGFFSCWTKKEAYVKAEGIGMGLPLRSFTVRLAEDTQVIRDRGGEPWSCYGLRPSEGYVGAVVAAGENWSLKFCEWTAESDGF